MKKIILLAAVSLLMSCESETTTINDISWINGSWTREFNGNTQIESWKQNDNSFNGKSSFANGHDTTLMMKYTIVENQDSWNLTSQDVGFETISNYQMVFSSPDSLLFSNQKNDWPKNIGYKKLGANKMEQTLDGVYQNGNKTISFTFLKDK